MRKKKKCQVIAHRGASALAEHENTLEAFDIAMELKADMVELWMMSLWCFTINSLRGRI